MTKCLLFVSVATSAAFAQEPARREVTGTPIGFGRSFRIQSKVLKEPRELNVFLPPAYATHEKPAKKFNVLYLIDGGRKQDFLHIAGLSYLASVNGIHEQLIVVGIRTQTRIAEMTHKPTDPRYIRNPPIAGRSAEFRKYVVDEVTPWVESRYRTGDRRVLMGESLAGLFVVETFLRQPTAFTDYVAVSPSLWFDDRNLAKSSAADIKRHDNQPRRLYLTMADEGGTMQKGLDELLTALKQNAPKSLEWYYIDRRTKETHASIYHGAAHDALRQLFARPEPDYGPPAWYMIEGGQPPNSGDRTSP